jgi:outer membrane protein OmpA-like peptidoglycan-associated protein
MLGGRVILKRGSKDEPEKPFWISFSDLMTALMVLFLFVMSVALLSVTRTVTDAERKQAEYDREIADLLKDFSNAARQTTGISVDTKKRTIEFGDKARFDTGSSVLRPEQARELRAFIPRVLEIADSPKAKRWLKRVVVEGYTDRRGSYLLNLNLSLQRSQRVLCALLDNSLLPGETALTAEQKALIHRLFLVGGYSFNSARPSFDESRRIELRLDFYGINETPEQVPEAPAEYGTCMI